MKCAVKICRNEQRKNDKSKSFFHFPRDEEQLKKWLIFCQNKGTFKANKWRICMDHFKEEDYGGKMYDMGYITKRTLRAGAIPCFYNVKQYSTKEDEKNARKKIIDSLLREYDQCHCNEPKLHEETIQPIPKEYIRTMPTECEDPLEIKYENISKDDQIEMLETEVKQLKKENEKLKDDLWRTRRKFECEIEELKKQLATSEIHCQSREDVFEDYIIEKQLDEQTYIIIKEEIE